MNISTSQIVVVVARRQQLPSSHTTYLFCFDWQTPSGRNYILCAELHLSLSLSPKLPPILSFSVSHLPHLSPYRAVDHSSSLLFHVLCATDLILQLHWLSCFFLYLPVITLSTLYTLLSSVISNTFHGLWEDNKFLIPVLDFKKISVVSDPSQMSRWTHMVSVCCWRWFSAEQVQVHSLPLGGDRKPKDSSKVVYTLLQQPRHWPGGKRADQVWLFTLPVLSFTNSNL